MLGLRRPPDSWRPLRGPPRVVRVGPVALFFNDFSCLTPDNWPDNSGV
jgi:hypothetical protein